MKLGFVSAILPELRFSEVCEFAAGEGFECIEVMCWPTGKAERKFAGVTHIDVTQFSNAHAEDTLATASHHGIEISALGYYPNVLDADSDVSNRAVRHLKKVIIAARRLNLSTVTSFVGADHRLNLEENFRRFKRIWPGIVRYAEDQGIRIAIENCPMLFTLDEWPSGKNIAYSPANWRRMFELIPSQKFGLNFDPSHLVWMQMDYLKPVREFVDRMFHVHAKDVRIHREHLDEVGILATPLQYHQPRIPGFGEIDWARFIVTLLEAAYDGPVCIEVEDDTFGKSLSGRKRALKTARNVLRGLVTS